MAQTIKIELLVDVDLDNEDCLVVSDIYAFAGEWSKRRECACLDEMTGPDGKIEEILTAGKIGEILLEKYLEAEARDKAEAEADRRDF